jgi:DNA-binding NtrC family response regulator
MFRCGLPSAQTAPYRNRGLMGVTAKSKTVLIVDDDLGFVFWLGSLLGTRYQVWPARSSADAAALMQELGAEVDLLVIDPNLSGASAFMEAQRSSRDFKTICCGAAGGIGQVDQRHRYRPRETAPSG